MGKDIQASTFEMQSTRQAQSAKAAMDKYGPEYKNAMEVAERLAKGNLQKQESDQNQVQNQNQNHDGSIGTIPSLGNRKRQRVQVQEQGQGQGQQSQPQEQVQVQDLQQLQQQQDQQLQNKVEEVKKEAKTMKASEGKEAIRKAEKKLKMMQYMRQAEEESVKYKMKKRRLQEELAAKERKVQDELNLLSKIQNIRPEDTFTTYELRQLVKMRQMQEEKNYQDMYMQNQSVNQRQKWAPFY
jgi:hypothetical protein